MCGKVNFTNLSRYSELDEKTYRRQYRQFFEFTRLNAELIKATLSSDATQIAGMDCSFIGKSGKATYGLDWFYNGSAGRSERGLEISVLAVIAVEAHQSYSLSVRQTPAQLSRDQVKPPSTQISQATLEQAREMLQHLPDKSKAIVLPEPEPPVMTRIDYYLGQLQDSRPYLPAAVQYLAVDAFYSKQKFVEGVVGLNLHMIGKLRKDANLRYLYTGKQKARGARRKYDGKVNLGELSRFTHVQQLEPNLDLYTLVVWHMTLKRQIRLACLVDRRKPGKIGVALLFSTDLELDAARIVNYYQARFQIEFIFRDAKQFTGLCDAQTRHPQSLEFHFNAALSALNLAKYETQLRSAQTAQQPSLSPFSMASYKRVAFNQHLLERFISKLDLDPTLIKSHPNYESLRAYGIIAY